MLSLQARVVKLDRGSLIISSLKPNPSRFDTADVSVLCGCEDIERCVSVVSDTIWGCMSAK